MKKSLLSFAIVTIVATTLFSCKSNSSSSEEKPVAEAVETVYQVDDVLQNGDTIAGKVIEIEGVCTHICKHGGRKIFLMGSDDKNTIRIESGVLGAFDQKCVNNIVKVNCTLVEDRIYVAYL